jgi:hypothetical protein
MLSRAIAVRSYPMRYFANPVRISGMLLGVCTALTVSAISQISAPTQASSSLAPVAGHPEAIPSCSGSTPGPSAAHAAQASPAPHSVTLSWKASIPASKSQPDAIQGYYVYRSLKSQTYPESSRISFSPVLGTVCVDTTVEPRTTYYYVVKAVSQTGTKSGLSNETKAVVPSP